MRPFTPAALACFLQLQYRAQTFSTVTNPLFSPIKCPLKSNRLMEIPMPGFYLTDLVSSPALGSLTLGSIFPIHQSLPG